MTRLQVLALTYRPFDSSAGVLLSNPDTGAIGGRIWQFTSSGRGNWDYEVTSDSPVTGDIEILRALDFIMPINIPGVMLAPDGLAGWFNVISSTTIPAAIPQIIAWSLDSHYKNRLLFDVRLPRTSP